MVRFFAALSAVAAVAVAIMSIGFGATPAHADPVGDRICQLFAAGGTPETVANSTAVKQALGGSPTPGEAMVLVRSVVAGQCPQFLWRF